MQSCWARLYTRCIAGIGLSTAFGVLLMLIGCDSHHERRDLMQERRQLETQRKEMEETIQQLTAGKTQFTDEEKARLGPLWIELGKVQGRIGSIDKQLQELD